MATKKQPDILDIVAVNVQMHRHRKGYTQKELAAKSGVDHADISRVESAQLNITILTLQHIADGLEVMAFELLIEQ